MKDYFNREIKVGDAVAIAGKVPGNYGFSPAKMLVGVVKSVAKNGTVNCKISKHGNYYRVIHPGSLLILNKADLQVVCPWMFE